MKHYLLHLPEAKIMSYSYCSTSRADEVYPLIATFGTEVTLIGEITAGSGLSLLSEEGREFTLAKKGFNHFDSC
jgi:thiamine monophosphate kinase